MAKEIKAETTAEGEITTESKLINAEAALVAAEGAKKNIADALDEEKKLHAADVKKLTDEITKLKTDNETLGKQHEADVAAAKEQAAKNDLVVSKLMGNLKTAVNAKETSSVDIANENKAIETPKDTIKLDGAKYLFKKPYFSIPGFGTHKSEEALHDEDLLRKLIAIEGQTVLVKQA